MLIYRSDGLILCFGFLRERGGRVMGYRGWVGVCVRQSKTEAPTMESPSFEVPILPTLYLLRPIHRIDQIKGFFICDFDVAHFKKGTRH